MSALRSVFTAATIILFIAIAGPMSWAQMPEWSWVGPWGGEVMALGHADSVVYAGTRRAGIYRSTDYGTTWEYLHSDVLGDYAHGFVSHGTTIIKEGGFPCRSSDRGETWHELNRSVFPSVMSFLGDTLIGVTWSGEVHSSTDYGESWEERSVIPVREINCVKTYGNEVFAGTNFGLFRSSDGGRSWEKLEGHPRDTCIRALHVTGKTVLAAGGDSDVMIEDRIYYSTDRGRTWLQSQRMTAGRVSGFVESGGKIMAATGYYGGVFSSTDEGATWRRSDNRTDGGEVIALVAIGDTILAGDGLQGSKGITRSFDAGITWDYANTGLSTIGITYLVSHEDVLLGAGRYDGIYRSTDRGGNWTRVEPGSRIAPVSAVISCGDFLLCGLAHLGAGVGGNIHRSSDGGASWNKVTTGTLVAWEFTSSGSTIAALVQPGSSNTFPLISTDYGATWNAAASPSVSDAVYHLLFNGSTLFAFTTSEIYRSEDLGANWTKAGDLRQPVTALCTIGETMVLGLKDGSFSRSTDYGSTWTDAAEQPAFDPILNLIPWQGDLYAATDQVIYRSTDAGDSWSEFSSKPGGEYLYTMVVHKSTLYAGTSTNGIFATTAPSSVESQDNESQNNEMTWLALAPNPAAGETFLRCLLRTPGKVRVEIFNGIGERVMAHQENMPSGEHRLRLDFSGQAAGYYLLRIETPEGIAVKKMLVGE